MHPRNIFRSRRPDFSEYAKTSPSLKPHLIKKRDTGSKEEFQYTIDFSDSQSLRELAIATLLHEFGLKVEIPSGHLIPSIPQRLNYIHWIEDLVTKGNEDIMGIDIGCGPVCIFPLLSCPINDWKFIATEIQPDCIKYARENVARNNLSDKIKVIQVTPDVLLRGVVDVPPYDHTHFTFCMCNPPFYEDKEDLMGESSRTGHRPGPATQNTGNEAETITRGGEVEFVKKIVKESMSIGTRIKWYTSMLGKKESLAKIKNFLKEMKVPVILETTFVQGKTHRWGVAWSHDHSLLPTQRQTLQKRRPNPFVIALPQNYTQEGEGYDRAVKWIKDTLDKLKIEHVELGDSEEKAWHCTTSINTWSKQRKRRRLMARIEANKDKAEELLAELESLNIPCKIEFVVLVKSCIDDDDDSKRIKRQKRTEDDEREENENNILYIFEWCSGNDKDELHQIVQLIENWLS